MEVFGVISSIRYSSFMNWDTNCGPRLDMTTWGIPWHAYTWSQRMRAHPSAKSSMLQATGMIALENRSTIIRIVSCPWESGSPVTISMEI